MMVRRRWRRAFRLHERGASCEIRCYTYYEICEDRCNGTHKASLATTPISALLTASMNPGSSGLRHCGSVRNAIFAVDPLFGSYVMCGDEDEDEDEEVGGDSNV